MARIPPVPSTSSAASGRPAGIDDATALHRSVIDLFRWLRAGRPAGAIGLSRLGLLGYLHRNGAASAAELAAYLRLQPQSLTRMLADLEQQQAIRRRIDPHDGRRAVIELARAGRRLVEQDVQAQRRRLQQAMRERLTPAEADMLRVAAGLMARLVQSGDAHADPAPESSTERRRDHEK